MPAKKVKKTQTRIQLKSKYEFLRTHKDKINNVTLQTGFGFCIYCQKKFILNEDTIRKHQNSESHKKNKIKFLSSPSPVNSLIENRDCPTENFISEFSKFGIPLSLMNRLYNSEMMSLYKLAGPLSSSNTTISSKLNKKYKRYLKKVLKKIRASESFSIILDETSEGRLD